MEPVSYSQFGEDLIVAAIFGSHIGRLLDIGAYHPKQLSNSRLLIERGWSGILIEPSPYAMQGLLEEYGRCDRVTLIQAAVSPEVLADMEITPDAVSTTEAEQYERWRMHAKFTGRLLVGTLTLPELTNRFGGDFDLINVDTEGTSIEIAKELMGPIGLEPKVLIVEHDLRIVELMQIATPRGYVAREINGTNAILVKA